MGHRARGVRLAAIIALTLLNCGWGADGHRIIGTIASARMGEASREAVGRLLGGASLAEVSTWADEIKSDSSWDWARPLHYVNMPYGASGYEPARDCPGGECVVGAIERYAAVLRDPAAAPADKAVALKFLVHFVGDLHQPLHACYAEDRGGNRINLTFKGDRTNLHRLWDSDLIGHHLGSAPWTAWADRLLANLPEADATRLAADLTPASWATESFGIARSRCYDLPRNQQVGLDYYQRNIGVVEQRLAAAGVRLAAMLDEIFAAAPVAPAGVETEPAPDPAEDPAGFVAVVLEEPCGPDGGRSAVLRNNHGSRPIRAIVRKSWMDGERAMSREKPYTVHPGEERSRAIGCTHARLRGDAVREFTWEIVDARWLDRSR